MKTEGTLPWYITGLERLINDVYIDMSEQSRLNLDLGGIFIDGGASSLVAFNHLAFPDPPFIVALLLRHWRDRIKMMNIPTSRKFHDMRMGGAGNTALDLAAKLGVGMPPIIQEGDTNYSDDERKEVNDETMEILSATLSVQGGVVPYAPEGTRSRTGVLLPSRSFADMMFHHPNAHKIFVQPIAMWGTEKLWPIDKKYPHPFHHVHIKVAEPVLLHELRKQAVNYDFSEIEKIKITEKKYRGKKPIGDMIMLHIAAMLPPEYRGVYGHLVG